MSEPELPPDWVPPPALPPLLGSEPFIGVDATVLDFWRFAMSDLRVNNVRGYLAEFLVARALGVEAQRVEWEDYDLLWHGVKIEVKSSAYLQAWPQRAPSQIRFTGLRGRAWGDITAGLAIDESYKSDVYVLSVLTTRDHAVYDPLDVRAWEFYVIPRAVLAELNVASMNLATAAQLADAVSYAGLAAAVRDASPSARRP
jgi:hypothetical protein